MGNEGSRPESPVDDEDETGLDPLKKQPASLPHIPSEKRRHRIMDDESESMKMRGDFRGEQSGENPPMELSSELGFERGRQQNFPEGSLLPVDSSPASARWTAGEKEEISLLSVSPTGSEDGQSRIMYSTRNDDDGGGSIRSKPPALSAASRQGVKEGEDRNFLLGKFQTSPLALDRPKTLRLGATPGSLAKTGEGSQACESEHDEHQRHDDSYKEHAPSSLLSLGNQPARAHKQVPDVSSRKEEVGDGAWRSAHQSRNRSEAVDALPDVTAQERMGVGQRGDGVDMVISWLNDSEADRGRQASWDGIGGVAGGRTARRMSREGQHVSKFVRGDLEGRSREGWGAERVQSEVLTEFGRLESSGNWPHPPTSLSIFYDKSMKTPVPPNYRATTLSYIQLLDGIPIPQSMMLTIFAPIRGPFARVSDSFLDGGGGGSMSVSRASSTEGLLPQGAEGAIVASSRPQPSLAARAIKTSPPYKPLPPSQQQSPSAYTASPSSRSATASPSVVKPAISAAAQRFSAVTAKSSATPAPSLCSPTNQHTHPASAPNTPSGGKIDSKNAVCVVSGAPKMTRVTPSPPGNRIPRVLALPVDISSPSPPEKRRLSVGESPGGQRRLSVGESPDEKPDEELDERVATGVPVKGEGAGNMSDWTFPSRSIALNRRLSAVREGHDPSEEAVGHVPGERRESASSPQSAGDEHVHEDAGVVHRRSSPSLGAKIVRELQSSPRLTTSDMAHIQAGTADLEMGDIRSVPGAGVRSPARSPFVRSASSIDEGRGVPLMDFEKDKKQVALARKSSFKKSTSMTNVTKVVTLGRRESLTIGSSPLGFQRSPSAGVSPLVDQQGSMAKLASFTRASSFARSISSWSNNEGIEDLQGRATIEPRTAGGLAKGGGSSGPLKKKALTRSATFSRLESSASKQSRQRRSEEVMTNASLSNAGGGETGVGVWSCQFEYSSSGFGGERRAMSPGDIVLDVGLGSIDFFTGGGMSGKSEKFRSILISNLDDAVENEFDYASLAITQRLGSHRFAHIKIQFEHPSHKIRMLALLMACAPNIHHSWSTA